MCLSLSIWKLHMEHLPDLVIFFEFLQFYHVDIVYSCIIIRLSIWHSECLPNLATPLKNWFQSS